MSKKKQTSLGFSDPEKEIGPVECLGQTFESDEARREHFLALLAEKLKDPEFRKTPGFPDGTDEAILRMSDPPYYTACPNPFLNEFVGEHGRLFDSNEDYHREPFAADVSEGKYDALYRAHPYHTKVPHLAIVPSILHYTDPGDIVLDGFCGSGMTGIAAQWCAIAPDGYRSELEARWRSEGRAVPQWGLRYAILNDLGPAATHIAGNYNIPFEYDDINSVAESMLEATWDEYSWMYRTSHGTGGQFGDITCTVWSEIFICQECASEIVFLEVALDPQTKQIEKIIKCPQCSAESTKEHLDLKQETYLDPTTNSPRSRPKRVPFLIEYEFDGSSYEKRPDEADAELLDRIDRMAWPSELPFSALPDSQMKRVGRMKTTGIEQIDDLYVKRSGIVLAAFWRFADSIIDRRTANGLKFMVDQCFSTGSILNRYRPASSFGNGPLRGVYYIPSQIAEASVFILIKGIFKRIKRGFATNLKITQGGGAVSTGDCGALLLNDQSVDYVFTDPPFGENIYYGDLNFLPESWYRVFTNFEREAIVDRVREKTVYQYQSAMHRCFEEYYRVLKPSRWMTVVFSNSKNHIWRAIQEALGTAGFVVADVRTLDKKQGSFKQVTSSAVKQDLVISAYKPSEQLAEQFDLGTSSAESVWSFVNEHLSNVPVFVGYAGDADIIAERTPQMLHDRMIAFFVQHRVAVPISGPDFFYGLDERYPKRDGMYFLHDQVSEYDRKRISVSELRQLDLFVTDEASATRWVRQQLQFKPQSFQDLQPQFMQQCQSWAKHEKTIDLKEILGLNFIYYDGDGPIPSQVHSYLSTNFKDLRKLDKEDAKLKAKAKDRWYVPDPKKEGDLEKLRLRTLLKEFDEYRTSTSRKIKQFRTEAVRSGFKHCYDAQDYQTIVDVAAKLPEQVIQEDEKLLMYYDVATMRLGDG